MYCAAIAIYAFVVDDAMPALDVSIVYLPLIRRIARFVEKLVVLYVREPIVSLANILAVENAVAKVSTKSSFVND